MTAKYYMIKDSRHANVDKQKPQFYTKHYRKIVNAENGRNSVSQQGTHKLIIKYQISENIKLNNIIKTEKVTFESIYIYAYVTINE